MRHEHDLPAPRALRHKFALFPQEITAHICPPSPSDSRPYDEIRPLGSGRHGTPLDEEMERRFILIEQHVIRLAWDAVELMFRTSGTSAAAKSSPLGRAIRNLAVIRTHVTLQLDHTATNAGRLHFGLPSLSRF
jgi:hypothetical protein